MKSSLVLFLSLFATGGFSAEVNSWTKSTSGYWEEPHWSLGRLPAGDYVRLTNAGWKALAIGWSTVMTDAGSLWIHEMEISAPLDSFNTLLLNYAGTGSPLRVRTAIHVGTNAAALLLQSALQSDVLVIDGTFTQADASDVVTKNLEIGYSMPGIYNMTNGSLRTTNMVLGRFTAQQARFNQHGGLTTTSNLLLRLQGRAQLGGNARFHVASNVIVEPGSALALTNAEFRADILDLGDWPTNNNPRSTFDHVGGSNHVARSINIQSADWYMRDAKLRAGTIIVGGQGHGRFEQVGGEVSVTNVLWLADNNSGWQQRYNGAGSYTLSGGVVRAPKIQLGWEAFRGINSDGTFEHFLGTNYTDELVIGMYAGGGVYNLRGGLLVTSNTHCGPGKGAVLRQTGGTHLAEQVSVRGYDWYQFTAAPGAYELSNGVLKAKSISIRTGYFYQRGGSNTVSGDLVLEEDWAASKYLLYGGQLTTSNTIMYSSRWGGFRHEGGTHRVAGLLDVHPPAYWAGPPWDDPLRYDMQFGELVVHDIRLRRGIFRHAGGMITQSGTLMMDGGTWELAQGMYSLGKLQVLDWGSSLVFPMGACHVRFAASSSPPWASYLLIIQNWNGNTNGGGMHRVNFGSNSTGLTSWQVAQIRFRNPVGMQSGDYFARMLPTGEVVPLPRPTMRYFRGGPEQFVIQWPPGYALQTATNVMGPYADVPGASSSYTFRITTEPARFFRLRNN